MQPFKVICIDTAPRATDSKGELGLLKHHEVYTVIGITDGIALGCTVPGCYVLAEIEPESRPHEKHYCFEASRFRKLEDHDDYIKQIQEDSGKDR